MVPSTSLLLLLLLLSIKTRRNNKRHTSDVLLFDVGEDDDALKNKGNSNNTRSNTHTRNKGWSDESKSDKRQPGRRSSVSTMYVLLYVHTFLQNTFPLLAVEINTFLYVHNNARSRHVQYIPVKYCIRTIFVHILCHQQKISPMKNDPPKEKSHPRPDPKISSPFVSVTFLGNCNPQDKAQKTRTPTTKNRNKGQKGRKGRRWQRTTSTIDNCVYGVPRDNVPWETLMWF